MEKSGESTRAPFSRKRVNNRDANMRSALRDSMGHGNWDDEPRATGIMERDATAARSRPQRDSDLINCGAFSEVFKYRNYFILSYFILCYVILFYFLLPLLVLSISCNFYVRH